jgi:hypothetical protein
LFGEFAKSNAILALLFPFFAAVSNLVFRAEINAISDIEKTPFSSIRKNIISISNFLVNSFLTSKLISDFLLYAIQNLVFSPDGNEKPGVQKANFFVIKERPKEAPLMT